MEEPSIERKKVPPVLRVAPGLRNLLGYRREWLRHDAVAGVSVAAVASPTAIAYAELIGFEPVVGLYAAILPLLVYAIFGTSRHLIVNPDAATCAMVGTTLMPLAAVHPNSLMSLSVALALFTGIFCILAGLLRLGFVADFLSKPILVGFLNGVAIHIFLGQIGKVFGFSLKSHGIVPPLLEFIQELPQTHLPTLAVPAGCRPGTGERAKGISQRPASRKGADLAGSDALPLWSGAGIFQRAVFQEARAGDG